MASGLLTPLEIIYLTSSHSVKCLHYRFQTSIVAIATTRTLCNLRLSL